MGLHSLIRQAKGCLCSLNVLYAVRTNGRRILVVAKILVDIRTLDNLVDGGKDTNIKLFIFIFNLLKLLLWLKSNTLKYPFCDSISNLIFSNISYCLQMLSFIRKNTYLPHYLLCCFMVYKVKSTDILPYNCE